MVHGGKKIRRKPERKVLAWWRECGMPGFLLSGTV
jgi:hypothetical protein